MPSYLYRPSLSRPFPLHSSLPVECESSFYPMRVYCIRTKVYTFVYSGGRGTFEHSFSISRFFRFLSLSHTLFISLSLSLHQTTRCTRISRISLIVYLRIVRYARRRTKYLMPDFFFLFLVPAYGGSTFYYRVNICLALSPNYKRDKQSRVFADQSSKVKRKKRETPKKRKGQGTGKVIVPAWKCIH